MKTNITQRHNSLKAVLFPVLAFTVALYGQSVLAGGNSSGQPSGSTVAGSTSAPTTTMNGLTSVIVSGSGPGRTTVTTPTANGGTQTTTTVSLPASTVVNTLNGAGLNPSTTTETVYQGPSGTTYTLSPENDRGTSTGGNTASASSQNTINSNGTFLLTQTSGVRIKVKAQLFSTR